MDSVGVAGESPEQPTLRATAVEFVPSSPPPHGAATAASPPEARKVNSEERAKFRGRSICSTSYVSETGQLFASELAGFMAAGAILWRRDASGEAAAVMALEMRQGKPRYNFLGGKRDTEAETPHIVAQREASEESGETLSADARRSMAQGDAMRPVLWHAGGKYCLFVFELPPADADLVERITARGGQPDSGDPELLSLHWVPLRHLLAAAWCRANLHGYVSDQLTLLRPYLATLVAGRRPLLGARVGDAVPLPVGAPALFTERTDGDETMRVLVGGGSRNRAPPPRDEAAAANAVAAERARLQAQPQQPPPQPQPQPQPQPLPGQQGGAAEPMMQRDEAQAASSPPRKPRQEKERRAPATRVCRNFGSEAGCTFGARCRFVHASPLAPPAGGASASAVAGVSGALANLTISAAVHR